MADQMTNDKPEPHFIGYREKIGQLEASLTAARQRIQALEQERDAWMASSAGYGSDMVEWKIRAEHAESELSSLKATLAERERAGAVLQLWAETLHQWACDLEPQECAWIASEYLRDLANEIDAAYRASRPEGTS